MRYLKWCMISFGLHTVLTLLAWFIDEVGWKKGVTEGSYQICANLISNLQFVFKLLLGIDDVINYNFRLLPFIMGAVVWLLAAIFLCKKRIRSEEVIR